MDAKDKQILIEHTQQMKRMEQEFQKFYKIAQNIIPEIERTQTLNRMEEELEEFKKKYIEL